MKSSNRWMRSGIVLALGTFCIIFVLSTRAQVKTTTSIQPGQGSEVVRVDRGEVLAVEGNDLIVSMEDGSVRHFENIPESAKVTVDGKQLGIHDLKPGMKLQRTITTTTTSHTVTTILTVTGKVWHVTPPLSVILTLENGTNQSFKIPKDQKFNVNGEMVDAFGLRKGMVVRAIKNRRGGSHDDHDRAKECDWHDAYTTANSAGRHSFADCPGCAHGCSAGDYGSACVLGGLFPCAYGSACCCHYGTARCPCENEFHDGRLSPTHRSGNTGAAYCFGRSKVLSPEITRLRWFEKQPENR